MHRRARHFNARDAGAPLVLDSRFITGLTDGDPVSTWSDRSGNGHDATQATSGSKPTFLTAQQGGCPAVDFDGTADFLIGTYSPTAVPRTVFVVFKVDQTASTNTFFQVPQQVGSGGWLARWGQFSGNWNISGDAVATNQTLASAPINATDAIIGTWASDS